MLAFARRSQSNRFQQLCRGRHTPQNVGIPSGNLNWGPFGGSHLPLAYSLVVNLFCWLSVGIKGRTPLNHSLQLTTNCWFPLLRQIVHRGPALLQALATSAAVVLNGQECAFRAAFWNAVCCRSPFAPTPPSNQDWWLLIANRIRLPGWSRRFPGPGSGRATCFSREGFPKPFFPHGARL